MADSRGNTRTLTVSFPRELAQQAEELAREESRTMSELLREAFRTYRAAQVRKRLEAGHGYGRERNVSYTEDDIEDLVKVVRAELRGKLPAEK